MIVGDALHRELLARLAARQPSPMELPLCAPVEHAGGVIEWSPSYAGTFFLRVVGERVMSAGLGRDATDAQRQPLARFLAALDPGVLERVSEEHPLRYLDGSPLPPTTGHAIVHSSLTRTTPSQLVTELLAARTYRIAFVHRSEIAEDMDVKWAKAQLIDLVGGLGRPPCSAFRFARKKPDAKKMPALAPGRPQGLSGVVSIVKTGDTVELENAWRHRLRLARPTATWLETNESRVFVGLDDAIAIARAFVDRDAILREPAACDSIDAATAYLWLEAGGRDVEGDTEPVDIVELSTNALVARFFVRREAETLLGRYELRDPRLTAAHVRPIFDGCYLHTLTRHHHRAHARTIRLTPTETGETFEYAYPPAGSSR